MNMADPSIQTFCCRRALDYHPSYKLMNEFNTDRFNMVCLLSSIIGITGAAYQILPKIELKVPNRFYSNIMRRGKYIIMWLAIADICASLGILLRSCLKLMHHFQWYDGQPYTVSCIFLAVWIQYFYIVTWFWTLSYAVDMWRAYQDKHSCRKLYHMVAWSIPAIFTFIGLSALYRPNAKYKLFRGCQHTICFLSPVHKQYSKFVFSRINSVFLALILNCHNLSLKENIVMKFLPNYFFTFLPVIVVMVVNPVLYSLSTGYIYHIITSYMAQYSTNERKMLDLFKQRFALINLAFYLCWAPNLINAVIVWTSWDNLPNGVMLTLWYLMAILNPMQAFFNSFLYNLLEHTEQICCKCFGAQSRVQEMVECRPLLIANVKGSSNSNGYEIIE